MDVKVHGKHNHVPESLEAFAQQKVGKLSKYLPTIDSIEVELYEEGKRKDSNHLCEVTVLAAGASFRAKTASVDHKACIDLAVDRLKVQLTQFNRKRSGKPAHARHTKEPLPLGTPADLEPALAEGEDGPDA